MKAFDEWLFRRIVRKQVIQDYDHEKKIQEMYQIIREEVRNEFTEDNEPTISDLLSGLFENTQIWPFGKPCNKGKLCPSKNA